MKIGLIGSTGLSGNGTLRYLNESNFVKEIVSISRKEPKINGPKIKTLLEADSVKWGALVEPKIDTFISAFGLDYPRSNKATFHDIEFNTIMNVAKACSDAGVPNFIVSTSFSANSQSMFQITKTKGLEEEALKKLNFTRMVILKTEVITGEERLSPKNFATRLLAKYFDAFKGTRLSFGLTPLSGDEYGKATVNILEKIKNDDFPKGVSVISQNELASYL